MICSSLDYAVDGPRGDGGGREEEVEEEEEPGGRRRERGTEDTEAETGRGRETENMLDRGGGGSCIQTDTERWDCTERDQEGSYGQEMQRKQVWTVWKTHERQAQLRQGLGIFIDYK